MMFTLRKDLTTQLMENEAIFEEIAKEEFTAIQHKFTRLRSMIYRTEETELDNGDSQLTFYSLCYVKKRTGTLYFESNATFVVPPYDFFGEKQEKQVLQWLIGDKARFLREQYRNKSEQKKMQSTFTINEQREVSICSKMFEDLQDNVEEGLEYQLNGDDSFLTKQPRLPVTISNSQTKLTEYEQMEVDICSKLFQQLEESDYDGDSDYENYEDIICDNEFPNFDLGYDFLYA